MFNLLATSESSVIFFGGAFCVAIVSIIASTIHRMSVSKDREQSRREIAAYVAEGSMTPEDGARLLAAGGTLKDKLREKLG